MKMITREPVQDIGVPNTPLTRVAEAMYLQTPQGNRFGSAHPLSDDCMDRVRVARTALIANYPFFGIVACKLQLMEDNVRCQTLATDGKHLIYNVGFIMGIPAKDAEQRQAFKDAIERAFPDATPEQVAEMLDGLNDRQLRAAIVHEILHCMMEHFIRKNNRQHNRWNKACDFAINQIIQRELTADGLCELRKSWLFDKKYDGMAAEEIYNMLPDDDSDDSEGGGTSFDHHYDPNGTPKGGDEEGGEDRGTVGSIFDDMDPEEVRDNFEDFKESVMSAALAADVPAGIKRYLDDLAEPKIDWKTKVKRTLQSWIKHDMAFQRPSRRSWALGCILPGFIPEEEIDICIALDMSGSITVDMAREMLSEVYGMTKQFNCFRIRLLTFDTKVYNPVDFDESNVEKLFEYDVKGGGGTSFECVWDYMKKEDYRPKQLLMFTDGYPCGSWGDPEYCDTLFIIHGTTTIKSPFGGTVYYEFENA